MEKIKIKSEFELEVKRFYLPVKIERDCPDCGTKCVLDLDSNYLSYPTVNKKEQGHCYCDVCDTEFEFDLTLKISLEAGKEVRKI